MTLRQIPVDECPAGPALDAAAAEILGWTHFAETSLGGRIGLNPETNLPCDIPKYSTNISAAWELVEELKMRCGYSHRRYEPFAMLECEKYGTLVQYADTVPLAITRAYLKAKGVEDIEVPDTE